MSIVAAAVCLKRSSNIDEFAALLDDDDYALKILERVKRHKVDFRLPKEITSLSSQPEPTKQTIVVPSYNGKKNIFCPHGVVAGTCWICGRKKMDVSLSISTQEFETLCVEDWKNLLQRRKLYLVLDLDHTLLNSVRLPELTAEEEYLNVGRDSLPDSLKRDLHRLEWINIMTKLRPFVHSFLKEASDLFEMYIYTMGDRVYAREMAKLLDPENVYFNSKVIARDCTKRHGKSLDVFSGKESAVVILDDKEAVWENDKSNLIVMERYDFFSASHKRYNKNSNGKSLSELKIDESESTGALPTVLKVLQRIHTSFFDSAQNKDLMRQDVRQVLRTICGKNNPKKTVLLVT